MLVTDLSKVVALLACNGYEVRAADPDYRKAEREALKIFRKALIPPPQFGVWAVVPEAEVIPTFERVAQILHANFPEGYFQLDVTRDVTVSGDFVNVWVVKTQKGLCGGR